MKRETLVESVVLSNGQRRLEVGPDSTLELNSLERLLLASGFASFAQHRKLVPSGIRYECPGCRPITYTLLDGELVRVEVGGCEIILPPEEFRSLTGHDRQDILCLLQMADLLGGRDEEIDADVE